MAAILMTVVLATTSEYGMFVKFQTKSSTKGTIKGVGTQVKERQVTYYYPINELEQGVTLDSLMGTEHSIDPDLFEVRLKTMAISTPDGVIDIETKWLYTK